MQRLPQRAQARGSVAQAEDDMAGKMAETVGRWGVARSTPSMATIRALHLAEAMQGMEKVRSAHSIYISLRLT